MLDFSEEIKKTEFNLTGHTMVEASAGTGKTYNIQNVYLRLILEQDLSVEEILVVTFTEAATHELRERIRNILSQARDYLSGRTLDNAQDQERMESIVEIVKLNDDTRAGRLGRIKLALMNFDNAAIFTIHGFCKRVLDRNSFECGHDPAAELIADETRIISNICMDWWRKNTYNEDDFRNKVAFKDLKELQGYVEEFLKRPDAALAPAANDNMGNSADLYSDLGKKLNILKDIANATDSPYTKPNAAAKRIMAVLPDCGKRGFDLAETKKQMGEMEKDLADANMSKPILEFPEQLREVMTEAQKAWESLGSLAGKSTWNATYILQRSDDTTINLEQLAEAVASNREKITLWLNNPQPKLKSNAGTRKYIEAITTVCSADMTWPETDDAKPFCQLLKAIGSSAPSDIFEIEKTLLIDIEPGLTQAIHNIKNLILGEMSKTIDEIGKLVRQNTRERGVLTYNDLLRNVSEALQNETTTKRLTKVLRDEFKAALIDEFQDTDPIQYSIFKILFKEKGTPLYFVGDPKQAIYGFRGGDVFTYYAAKIDIGTDNLQNLGTNFRSEEHLVDAINELFKDGDSDDKCSFINKDIPYDGKLKPNPFDKNKALLINGARDDKPLKLNQYTYEKQNPPGADSNEAKRIYSDTADEIVRLIGSEECHIGDRTIVPSDIAVLVCTHDEAKYIHTELKVRNINAVLQSTGNVFDSEDAKEIALVIQAMLDPADVSIVRGALITSIVPCSIEALQRFSNDTGILLTPPHISANDSSKLPITLEGWLDIIKISGKLWREHSFAEAFRYLMYRLDMRSHIVGLKNGERRLTNILHLAELAHKASSESQQGPMGLAGWFNCQLNSSTREDQDDFEVRLASDDDAVKIMTIFKSKGLQFPIVFAPTLWRKRAQAKHMGSHMLTYHADNAVIMNLDTNDEVGQAEALSESLQENLRLVYVALTRAIHRTYITSITAGDDNNYAMQRLVNAWQERQSESESSHINLVEISFDDPAKTLICTPVENPTPLNLETYGSRTGLSPKVNKSHGHTSFSGLEPNARDAIEPEARDIDAGNDDAPEDETKATGSNEDIFSIKGGKITGNCWHDIFEKIDFQSAENIRQTTDMELDRCGICKGLTEEITNARKDAVHTMVDRVISAQLQIGREAFSLKEISLSHRRSEMAFDFSLKQDGSLQTTSVIRDLLKKHWEQDQVMQHFLPSLNSWDKPIPLGFMTGFIDLVCIYNNRFYILDWKSNKRFGNLKNFNQSGIIDEMGRTAYFLQYLIYTVALHGFLSQELKDYDYEKHFGGIFYIFLRGVTGKPGEGIFSNRPSLELIQELTSILAFDDGGNA